MALLIAVRLSAQEKAESAPRKAQDAVEKLSQAPSAAAKASPEPSGGAAEPQAVPTVKRDPFRPFTLNVRSSTRRRENLEPLERFELGQLKLVAIIWGIKEPTAMVEDSASLGYVVRVGTPIGVNDGKVKTINPNGLIVEEFIVDIYGAKKKHEVEMKLSVEKSE